MDYVELCKRLASIGEAARVLAEDIEKSDDKSGAVKVRELWYLSNRIWRWLDEREKQREEIARVRSRKVDAASR